MYRPKRNNEHDDLVMQHETINDGIARLLDGKGQVHGHQSPPHLKGRISIKFEMNIYDFWI